MSCHTELAFDWDAFLFLESSKARQWRTSTVKAKVGSRQSDMTANAYLSSDGAGHCLCASWLDAGSSPAEFAVSSGNI